MEKTQNDNFLRAEQTIAREQQPPNKDHHQNCVHIKNQGCKIANCLNDKRRLSLVVLGSPETFWEGGTDTRCDIRIGNWHEPILICVADCSAPSAAHNSAACLSGEGSALRPAQL